jgi:hypothetical protein
MTCRSSMASAAAVRVSSGASGDEGRTVDVDGVVELWVLLDVVGNKSAVDTSLGLALAQVFKRVARQCRSDASVPLVLVHVRVRERDPVAGSLVGQVTDDPAIDQRLVEAGGLVLAHLNGGW